MVEPAAVGGGGPRRAVGGADEASRLARLWRRLPDEVGVFLVGLVIAIMRPADAAQRFTLGSEDAPIFVTQPRDVGLWRSLRIPYNGYLHLLPRLVGGAASLVPLRFAPTITYTGAAVLVALAAVVAYRCARGSRLSRPAALVIAGSVLILPAGSYEVVGNLPNVQWYCLAATVVFVASYLMGYRPVWWITVPLLVMAGLTTPLVGVALPFFAIAAVRTRRRYEVAVLVSTAAAVFVQMAVKVRSTGASQAITLDAAQALRLYSVRVGVGSAVGDRVLVRSYDAIGLGASELIGGLIVVVVLAAALSQHGPDRFASISLLFSSVVILASSLALRPDWFAFSDVGLIGDAFANGRYMSVPAVCLVTVVVLRADRLRSATPSRRVRRAVMAGFAVLGLVLVVNTPIELYRPARADFDRELAKWQASCASNGNDGIMGIRTGPFASAPVGFELRMSCHNAFD